MEEHTGHRIVAQELRNKGFQVNIFHLGVEVTLQNRKISNMEVKTALEQAFGEIDFQLQSTQKGVFVS